MFFPKFITNYTIAKDKLQVILRRFWKIVKILLFGDKINPSPKRGSVFYLVLLKILSASGDNEMIVQFPFTVGSSCNLS